jgi:putative hydrolase of the HAD superfamily
MIRVVIFDLDDTLYLEGDYVRSGFQAVARWLATQNLRRDGRSPKWVLMDYEWDLWNESKEDPDHALDRYAAKWRAKNPGTTMLTEEIAGTMLQIYRSHQPEIQACPDALKVLPVLSRDLLLGILSDGDVERQQRKLQALNIAHLFGRVIFTGANPAWAKPSPEGFRVLAREMGCRHEECLYVADNPVKDFAGPKCLGMRTLRIRRPGSLHESREAEPGQEPEATLTSMLGLPDIVHEMNIGLRSPGEPGIRRGIVSQQSHVHILGLTELAPVRRSG